LHVGGLLVFRVGAVGDLDVEKEARDGRRFFAECAPSGAPPMNQCSARTGSITTAVSSRFFFSTSAVRSVSRAATRAGAPSGSGVLNRTFR
jgi:hypothetical protein